jgi:hypothetical protein
MQYGCIWYAHFAIYKGIGEILMDDILQIRINQMQEVIKLLVTKHKIDKVTLVKHITDALKEVGENYTFTLINPEDTKK